MDRRVARLGRAAGAAALGLIVAVGGAMAALDVYGQTDRARPADVIVVLGAQMLPNGEPGPSLARRARHAAALYHKGLAPVVLCSGGVGRVPPSEARGAFEMLVSLGVPREAMVLEESARSTEETALYSAAIMREHGWRTAVLVTDGFHAFRAMFLFERAGIAAVVSPAQGTAGPMPLAERMSREAREVAALAGYELKTMLGLPVTNLQ